ncbi:Thymidylate kinase (fragment) [Pseudodesulfovibrio piezophilus C1TLV30]|uniref:Thymidylate kinase n=1 Tax=Pseudodesulfovibrio piezophilus (strain DSM 21447 / JCM 15486 / C1TLV30) TaxID=1322246 RepID=M1WPC9_PSEP2
MFEYSFADLEKPQSARDPAKGLDSQERKHKDLEHEHTIVVQENSVFCSLLAKSTTLY